MSIFYNHAILNFNIINNLRESSMKILMWIGIIFLAIFVIYLLIAAALAFYVNNPSTHNASAIESQKSNQYYMKDSKVVYVRDGNFFQIGETAIEGADPLSFEVIDHSYAKDSNNIYYNGKLVSGVSPHPVLTVKAGLNISGFDSGYLISGDKVLSHGEVITDADPETFLYLQDLYAVDAHNLYYHTDNKMPQQTLPHAIDNASDRYIQHGNQILYQGNVISEQGSQFKMIDDEYASDSLHVYSNGSIVEEMVPEGFTVISRYYRKDKYQAYYFKTPIPESDPNTFEVLNDTLSRDKQHLYHHGYIVKNKQPSEVSRSDADELQKLWKWKSLHLDPTHVIIVPSDDIQDITHSFFAYQNEVYTRTKKLTGITPEEIIILDQEEQTFTQIGSQVFYYDLPIQGADSATFSIITDNFSKDANHVYWHEHKVLDADPSSFVIQDNLFADENEQGEYRLKIAEY